MSKFDEVRKKISFSHEEDDKRQEDETKEVEEKKDNHDYHKKNEIVFDKMVEKQIL